MVLAQDMLPVIVTTQAISQHTTTLTVGHNKTIHNDLLWL